MTGLPTRDLFSTDLPFRPLSGPELRKAALPVLPLWLGALAGLITGLVTTALVQAQAFTASHPELTAALLALTSVLGLGVVFLGLHGPSPVFLPLAVRVAGLAALCAANAALHSGGDLPVVLALTLALAGAALIAARQTGLAGLLPFLVSSVLVAGLAGILAALFTGLLELAAALVNAVGFAGPHKVLNDAWVLPSMALAAGGFFVAALRQAGWAETLTQALATLLGLLLPMAALIITLFTVLLSSYLYLSLTLVTLALTASVTAGRPLPAWADCFTRLAALPLPLYPLLAVYGLSTRALQYGLTPDRVLGLAASVWLLATTVLNAWGSWRRGRPLDPQGQLARPAFLSMLLAALSVLLSVPGLRPPELSAHSQASRLHGPALSTTEATAAQVQDALALSTSSFSYKYPQGTGTLPQTLNEAVLQPITGSGPVNAARLEAVRQNLLKSQSSPGSNATYSSSCSNPGDACILRHYALPAGEVFGDIAILILLLGPYQPYEGSWFGFNGERIVRQGHYGTTYAEPQGSSSKTPFDGGAVTTSITLPALQVQGNILFLTEDKTGLPSK